MSDDRLYCEGLRGRVWRHGLSWLLAGALPVTLIVGCGRTRQERFTTGTAAKAGLQLALALGDLPQKKGLPATLTVTNNSEDPTLWSRAVSDAYGRGCVYFTEAEDCHGFFRLGFEARELAKGESMTIHIDLGKIRRHFQENSYFRERVGNQKIGSLVFLNFDNQYRSNIETLRSDCLVSNTVFVDPTHFK